MKKDIKPAVAKDIAVAIVREKNELDETIWNVYLLNLKKVMIEGVLVSSKGYGEKKGEKIRTTMLRHFLDEMAPKSFKKIEPIMKDVFGISNEYWVSFYVNKKMYDKKYVFVAESIKEENFTQIPLIQKSGVLII